MTVPRKFLILILAHQYQITDHAIESMDEDGLEPNDILSCLADGRVRRSWPRQHKYEIQGRSVAGKPMRVVGRLLTPTLLRIVTVYEIKHKK